MENLRKPELMLEVATRNLGLVTTAQHRRSKTTDAQAQEFLLLQDKESQEKKADKEEEEADDAEDMVR